MAFTISRAMHSRDLAISTADAKKGRREVWCEGLRECVYVVGRGLDARGCSGGVGANGAAEEAAHGGRGHHSIAEQSIA